MSRTLVWTVGEGGFLGSRVRALLTTECPSSHVWPPTKIKLPWDNPMIIGQALAGHLRGFLEAVRTGFDRWAILWCAGAGVIQSSDEALWAETRTFAGFLGELREYFASSPHTSPGLMMMASSAGAVYGDGGGSTLTEDSPCKPISEYGHQKLAQEEGLRRAVADLHGVRYLIGRFSTLYGTGQNLRKPQGLISQLVRSVLLRIPTRVYVPLDSQRDFLFVTDAARQVLRCLAYLLDSPTSRSETKIFASERSVSLSEVIALLKRISRQPVRILGGSTEAQKKNPGKLKYRSKSLTQVRKPPATSLAAGVYAVHEEQVSLLQKGLLPIIT